MSGDADPIYVAARATLLDALQALEKHRASIILVGAQAIYQSQRRAQRATPAVQEAAECVSVKERLKSSLAAKEVRCTVRKIPNEVWCRRGESNPHGREPTGF